MSDPRFIECPYCNGEGVADPDYSNARCRECDGTGSIEAEAEPITLDDLDEVFG